MAPQTRLQNPSAALDVDVVVVGAGLSGLQAATDLQKAGLSFVVLEAKDRVGGKTQSVRMDRGNGVLDVGAAWINDTTHPKMSALYRKFGCEPLVQRTQGAGLFRGAGMDLQKVTAQGSLPVDEYQQRVHEKIYMSLETDSAKIDLYDSTANKHIDDISLGEYFRQQGARGFSWDMWTLTVRALMGCEPDNISLVYFLDYVKSGGGLESLLTEAAQGAQYLRNRKGNQTISLRLAADLLPNTVHLHTPVTRIRQTADHCVVETYSQAIFRCRKVVLSIPTPLYRHIDFSPTLPAEKLAYAGATHLGAYSKCVLVYSKPWWREAGLTGGFCDLDGPIAFSRDVSSDEDGMFAIACFLFGDYAIKWSRLPPSRRVDVVKEQLADMAGKIDPELQPKVFNTIQIIEKQWLPEQWSEGAPCPVPAPGGTWARLGNELRKPFNRIHFIGTETAFEWKGYMEGAVRSGERGAQEVVEALKSGDRASARL